MNLTAPFVEVIQDLPLSQAVADTLQGPIRDALGESRKNVLQGKFLGHPLHPVLTDIPIGVWTAVAILENLPFFRQDTFDGVSDRLTGLGVVSALAAAAAGAADWSETRGRAARIGVAHAACNIVGTALYAASIVTAQRGTKRLLRLAGLAAVSAGGLLGGHLVFVERTGVQ